MSNVKSKIDVEYNYLQYLQAKRYLANFKYKQHWNKERVGIDRLNDIEELQNKIYAYEIAFDNFKESSNSLYHYWHDIQVNDLRKDYLNQDVLKYEFFKPNINNELVKEYFDNEEEVNLSCYVPNQMTLNFNRWKTSEGFNHKSKEILKYQNVFALELYKMVRDQMHNNAKKAFFKQKGFFNVNTSKYFAPVMSMKTNATNEDNAIFVSDNRKEDESLRELESRISIIYDMLGKPEITGEQLSYPSAAINDKIVKNLSTNIKNRIETINSMIRAIESTYGDNRNVYFYCDRYGLNKITSRILETLRGVSREYNFTPLQNNDNIVSYYDNGVKYSYVVYDDVLKKDLENTQADSILSDDFDIEGTIKNYFKTIDVGGNVEDYSKSKTDGIISRLLKSFAQVKRKSITSYLPFKYFNFITDQVSAYELYGNKLSFKELNDFTTDRESIHEFNMSGANMETGTGDTLKGKVLKSIRKVTYNDYGGNKLLQEMDKFLRWYDNTITKTINENAAADFIFGSGSENSTRYMIYKQNKQKYIEIGIDEETAKVFAAYDARDLLDFSMRGNSKYVNLLTSLTPFLRSTVNANITMIKNKTFNPVSLMRNTFVIGFTTFLLGMLQVLYKIKIEKDKDFELLTDDELNKYFHLFNLRILKTPFGIGKLTYATGIHCAFDLLNQTKDTDRRQEDILNMLYGIMKQELEPSYDNFATMIFDVGRNRNPFHETPIIPDYMKVNKNMNANDKYTESTNKLIVNLTDKLYDKCHIDVSPMILEYIVRQQYGTLAKDILRASNYAAIKLHNMKAQEGDKYKENYKTSNAFKALFPFGTIYYENNVYTPNIVELDKMINDNKKEMETCKSEVKRGFEKLLDLSMEKGIDGITTEELENCSTAINTINPAYSKIDYLLDYWEVNNKNKYEHYKRIYDKYKELEFTEKFLEQGKLYTEDMLDDEGYSIGAEVIKEIKNEVYDATTYENNSNRLHALEDTARNIIKKYNQLKQKEGY